MSLFSQQTLEGVQATAKVDEGHLTIEVRRSIQGITVSFHTSHSPRLVSLIPVCARSVETPWGRNTPPN